MDVFEELLEYPQERVIVFGPKQLCDKPSPFPKELCGQLQGMEC